MLYPKENINEFKGTLKTALQDWAEKKIDALCDQNPYLRGTSVYLKRGLNNWLEREDASINKMVDNALLFVANKDGGIDSDILIDDFVGMFKEMDKQQMKLGPFIMKYGKGEINLNIPNNFILDMLFGKLGTVHLTSKDILEIKDLL